MKTLTRRTRVVKIPTPCAVIPQDNYDSLVETLEVLSDRKILDRIESAIANIRKGRTFSHKEVFGHKPNGKV